MNKLICVVALTILFVAIELVGGIYADSVAIISDAAHLVSDVLGVSISIIALKISENEANSLYTYGYHRAEVLGALASILFIWIVTAILVYEATMRVLYPHQIDATIMMITSIVALVFNLIQMSQLHSKDIH